VPHFNQKVSDFDEIWCTEANSDIKTAVIAPKSAISKEYFGHNSAPNYLILVKFCVMMKNHILITVT